MGVVVDIDRYAGSRSRVRPPTSPGPLSLWWARVRGARGKGRVLSAALPELYGYTPASREALGRVVESVAQSLEPARPSG